MKSKLKPTTGPARSWTWPAVLGITLAAHASYIGNGFVWLDHIDIEAGKALVALSQWWTAFAVRYAETGFYRPLVTLLHSADHALYGNWAPGFHLTNLLLHAAVTAMAVLVFRDLLSRRPDARLSAGEQLAFGLVVGLHPLTWLPAGAISYRPELLVTLFVLCTVYAHQRAVLKRDRRFVVLAAAFLFLALCSKESALVWAPGALALWELSRRRIAKTQTSAGTRRSPKRKESSAPNAKGKSLHGPALYLSEAGVLVLYLLLRWQAVPDLWEAGAVSLSLSEALGTRLSVLPNYAIILLSPLKPSLSDATRVVAVDSLLALGGVLLLAFFILTLWRTGLRSGSGFGLIWIALALAPALNIVPLPRFTSPHYAYFALPGLAALVILASRALKARQPALHRAAAAVYGLWLAVAGLSTMAAGTHFQSDLTLFQPEVRADANFLEGQYYLGDYFVQQGELEQAERAYRAALANPANVIAYVDQTAAAMNLAGLLLQQNRLAEAEEILQRAAAHAEPRRQPEVAYNRALVASRQKNDGAVVTLLAERPYVWQRPEPLLLLANSLRNLGRMQEALQTLEQALPLLDLSKRAQLRRFIKLQREKLAE